MIEVFLEYGTFFLIGSWPDGPIGGLAATLILSILGLTLSFPLALTIGVARTSEFSFLRGVATGWVYIFRGIPLIMIVFWSYFLLPRLTGVAVSAFMTALAAIVVYESAFLGEIVRAGIQALPRGQSEAARAIGLGYMATMRYAILPQALINMLPSLVNQFVSTIKATSIVYIIGVQEVTFVAQQINTIEINKALQTYLIIGFLYFFVCYGLSLFAQHLERRLRRRSMGAA